MNPVPLTPEQYQRHAATLAKDTNTNLEAVEAVTSHMAEKLAARAMESAIKAPEYDAANWLEVALACNAAKHKSARALIEHKARVIIKEKS